MRTLLAMVGLFLLAGCGQPAPATPAPVTLTDKDLQRSVHLVIGQKLYLKAEGWDLEQDGQALTSMEGGGWQAERAGYSELRGTRPAPCPTPSPGGQIRVCAAIMQAAWIPVLVTGPGGATGIVPRFGDSLTGSPTEVSLHPGDVIELDMAIARGQASSSDPKVIAVVHQASPLQAMYGGTLLRAGRPGQAVVKVPPDLGCGSACPAAGRSDWQLQVTVS